MFVRLVDRCCAGHPPRTAGEPGSPMRAHARITAGVRKNTARGGKGRRRRTRVRLRAILRSFEADDGDIGDGGAAIGPALAQVRTHDTERQARGDAHGVLSGVEGNLEGEQGPGRTGRRTPSQVFDGTDLLTEQGLEGQRPIDTNATTVLETEPSPGSRIEGAREVRGGNERGDAPRLRAGGVLRGVRTVDAGNHELVCPAAQVASDGGGRGAGSTGRVGETHRTPGSAAGCNKSASPLQPRTVAGSQVKRLASGGENR